MIETKFKETEVGRVPADWEVKTLGEIGSFSKGMGISRAESNTGSIPAIRYGEIYTSHNDYIKGFFSYINEDVASRSKRLKCGDILFTASGETKEDIAKAVAFIDDIEAYASGDIIVLSPKTQVDSKCLGFLLNTEYVIKQRASKAQGDAIVHITTNSIQSIAVSLPPLPEQRRIASVLSNIDDLISSLDTLIEKKRNIKQGAMRQLLTGKTRLKGFTEPWVEKKLGEIGYTYNGLSGKSADDFGHGNAQYITFLNILNNVKIDTRILEKVSVDNTERQNAVQKGDLFFNTSSETPEEVGICSVLLEEMTDTYLNSFCFGYRVVDSEVLELYLSYYFRSRMGRKLMSYLAQGSTRYNLSKDSFLKSSMVIPSTISEQHAIASILTKMDDEIAALEQKREKYVALKQGMMQQLLTGKIRLTD